MIYDLLRPLLFQLDAERAHYATLAALKAVRKTGLGGLLFTPPPPSPQTVMGLQFPNPVGLAAGLDKNGAYIDALAALGFGFIEIGTVTPRPQPGNPQPRLFRLPHALGIINRMGFNNDGVDQLVRHVQRAEFKGVLGINIGKNFDTPLDRAAEDYLFCMRKIYSYASYITVNISSPNTKNLRQLQEKSALDDLLATLKQEQKELADRHGKYTPVALKIAPDLEPEQIAEIAELLLKHRMDGVIATNTTLSRAGIEGLPHAAEIGGLSGAPVREKSTGVIRQLSKLLGDSIPVIGVGGILNGQDAMEKTNAGARLVQLYTGLIYRGPDLVSEVAVALQNSLVSVKSATRL